MAASAMIAKAAILGAAAQRRAWSKPAALSPGFDRAGHGGLIAGPVSFLRSIGQGACAGLLAMLGATHLIEAAPLWGKEGAAAEAVASGGLDGFIEAALAGGAPGALELVGAAALFLSAGRGPGKVIGLLAFVAIAWAHAQGVDHSQMIDALRSFAETALAAIERAGLGAGAEGNALN